MLHFSGVPGSVRLTRAGSVAAVRSLFQIASSVSRERDRVAEALRHLRLPVEPENLRRRREQRLRLGERVAEARVEPAHDLARQLEVLALIFADRHARRAVEQDVGRLQHRIGEEARVDVVGLMLRLVLELRHPAELAERRHRRQHPRQLGVFGHRRLHEQRRAIGIDAAREHVDRHRARARRHLRGLVRLRDRVVVDDAIEAAVLPLQRHPVPDGAQVVAEVQLARRLDTREHRLHRERWFRRHVP